ncbi:hypothetical protein ACIPZG_05710 [Pseudomonas sp. NPDC089395]|uniref:hypothetical protein n=1 Tax=unclassified Pseudomonas TaxID=196821 RepID=UPI00300B3299
MSRSSRRRYDKEFKKILRKDGDRCGICRKPLEHNCQTFGGFTADGTTTLTSECCRHLLHTLMGSGVYVNQNTDAIRSVLRQMPQGQGPATDVIAAAERMRSGVNSIDRLTQEMMAKGGLTSKPTGISLTETPWKSDDAAWFDRNKNRTHRMRQIYPGEFETLPPEYQQLNIPDDHRLEIVVRQVKKGQRIRSAFCRNLSVEIPDTDEVIHVIFDWVAGGGNGAGVMTAQELAELSSRYKASSSGSRH